MAHLPLGLSPLSGRVSYTSKIHVRHNEDRFLNSSWLAPLGLSPLSRMPSSTGKMHVGYDDRGRFRSSSWLTSARSKSPERKGRALITQKNHVGRHGGRFMNSSHGTPPPGLSPLSGRAIAIRKKQMPSMTSRVRGRKKSWHTSARSESPEQKDRLYWLYSQNACET